LGGCIGIGRGLNRATSPPCSDSRSPNTEPRPPGCEKLTGATSMYRVRQRQYRIIYLVDDAAVGGRLEGGSSTRGGSAWALSSVRSTTEASARLRRLADLLPAIEVEGFIPATFEAPQGQMPYARYVDELEELHRLVYADDWIRYDLGWPTWMESSEARALLEDPAAMREATPEQLARVLTVIVRLERFSDGTTAGAVRSGLVARLLRRAAVLAEATEDP
jgi:hypothetical protein